MCIVTQKWYFVVESSHIWQKSIGVACHNVANLIKTTRRTTTLTLKKVNYFQNYETFYQNIDNYRHVFFTLCWVLIKYTYDSLKYTINLKFPSQKAPNYNRTGIKNVELARKIDISKTYPYITIWGKWNRKYFKLFSSLILFYKKHKYMKSDFHFS